MRVGKYKRRVAKDMYAVKTYRAESLTRDVSREGLNRRLEAFARTNYKFFSVQHSLKHLGLGKQVLRTFTPKTRVLELGSGSGRLTAHLLKNSNLKPENYTMVDLLYGEHPPYFVREVYDLIKSGKLKTVGADFSKHAFEENAYDQILVPEAFFPSSDSVGRQYMPLAPVDHFSAFKSLVKRLSKSLKKGGALRFCSNGQFESSLFGFENLKNAFPGFEVIKPTHYGIVLWKK